MKDGFGQLVRRGLLALVLAWGASLAFTSQAPQAQEQFFTQSGGRGLQNAKTNARLSKAETDVGVIQEDLKTIKPHARAELGDCSGAGEKLRFDGKNWICEKETDPTVQAFAKKALPSCALGTTLGVVGGDLGCSTNSFVTVESDPTVQQFAKIPLPTCGPDQLLAIGSNNTLKCLADQIGVTNEQDPKVHEFARKDVVSTLPNCPVNELLTMVGGRLACRPDQVGITVEVDPQTQDFARKDNGQPLLAPCVNGQVLRATTLGGKTVLACESAAGTLTEVIGLNDLTDVITTGQSSGTTLTYSNGFWRALPGLGTANNPINLSQLGDATVTTPTADDVLRWNGTRWVNSNDKLGTLTDTNWCRTIGTEVVCDRPAPLTCASGEILSWNGTGNTWVCSNAASAVGGALQLNDLQDVTITTVTAGQVVRWDGVGWVNSTIERVLADDTQIIATDTGTNGLLSFATDGLTRMAITNDGRIGVGVMPSAPYMLDISGSLRASTGISTTDLVAGNGLFTGNLTVAGNLNISGSQSIDGVLFANGGVAMAGTLTSGNISTTNLSATVADIQTLRGNNLTYTSGTIGTLQANSIGFVTLSGTTLNATDISVSRNVTINGNLDVAGNQSIGGVLFANGGVQLSGDILAGRISVTNISGSVADIVTLRTNALAADSATLSNATIAQATLTNISVTVADITTLRATQAQLTNISATQADLTSNLKVSGTTWLESLNIRGNLNVSGSQSIDGVLFANGGISLTGAITSGNISVTNLSATLADIRTLRVTNNATVGGNLGVTGGISGSQVSVTNNLTVGGTLTAGTFVGDGSGLTGLANGDRIISSTTAAVIANQSGGTISFTLGGTAGAAYLHPSLGLVVSAVSTTGNGNFMNVNLPWVPAGNTNGQLQLGGTPILHFFKAIGSDGLNTFLGQNSGNTTMAIAGQSYHASTNTGVGYNSLISTTTGYYNTANGVAALQNNTSGFQNTSFGGASLADVTTGTDNTALGFNTGRGITYGSKNTILGANVTDLAAGLYNNIIIADGTGNRRINVDSTGNVGVNTTTPTAMLTLANGEIQIASSGMACTAPLAGAIRYSGGALQFCNGTAWATLSSAGAADWYGLTNIPTQVAAVSNGTFISLAGISATNASVTTNLTVGGTFTAASAGFGPVAATNISATALDLSAGLRVAGLTSLSNVSATNISATRISGDGSGLTNLNLGAANLSWYNLLSVPTQVAAVSDGTFISLAGISATNASVTTNLTVGGTLTAASAGFGPVAATNISATALDLSAGLRVAGLTSLSNVSATNISATRISGDGSGLTNLNLGAASLNWYNLLSIPTQVAAVSNGTTLSMSTISTTNLSATTAAMNAAAINTATIGVLSVGTISTSGIVSVSGLYSSADITATGRTVTAARFIGDGSGLTGVIAAGSDRITSGTTQLIVISNTGYISLTQAGSNTGWFDPSRGLVTLGVSATGGISGSTGYFSSGIGIGTAPSTYPLALNQSGPNGVLISRSGHDSYGLSLAGSLGLNIRNVTDSRDEMIFDGNGRIGIGTNSPSSSLHIAGGEVQTASSGAACTAPLAGAIRYSGGALQFCNGTAWATLSSAGAADWYGLTNIPTQVAAVSNGTVVSLSLVSASSISGSQVSVTNNLTVGGTLTAGAFVGDGSGLTGLNVQGDRITSSTTAGVFANQSGGTVSFTLGGTAQAAYLHPTLGLVAPGVSATGAVSATRGYFGALTVSGTGAPFSVYSNDNAFTIGARYGTSAGYIGSINNGLLLAGSDASLTGVFIKNAQMGVGTITPAASLTIVAGEIQTSTSGAACTAPLAGAMRYSASSLSYCNGNAWVGLSSGTVAGIDDLNDATKDTTNYNLWLGSELGTLANNQFNTAVGLYALDDLTNTAGVNEGDQNTAMGYAALTATTTGLFNTGLGSHALYYNTTGSYNTALGGLAMQGSSAYASQGNTSVGYAAHYTAAGGGFNANFGYAAAYLLTTGQHNQNFGAQAGYDLTTGSDNTILGYNTGRGITTGSNNTILGSNVTGLPAGLSNTIIIADGAGNRRINVTNNGNVGVANTNPQAALDVSGSVLVNGALTITSQNAQITLFGESPWAQKWAVGSSGAVSEDDFIIYDYEAPAARLLIDDETGYIGIGNNTPAAQLAVGAGSVLTQGTSVTLSVRAASAKGNSLEWGHSNPNGYGSSIGYSVGGGQPHICLHCEAGSTNNTFRTRGIKGILLNTNNAGSMLFQSIENANADNQASRLNMALTAEGALGLGTVTPAASLTIVAGEVQTASSGMACTAPLAGAIRYSGGALQFCNGTAWTTLGSAGAADWYSVSSIPTQVAAVSNGTTLAMQTVTATALNALNISGTNGYFANIGIGISPTYDPLHISAAGGRGILLEGTSPRIMISGTAVGSKWWSLETGNAVPATGLLIRNLTDGYVQMAFAANGNIGIGASAPAASLTIVAGEIQTSTSGAACTAPLAGAIRYSGGALQFCNGTAWATLGSAGAADWYSVSSIPTQVQNVSNGTVVSLSLVSATNISASALQVGGTGGCTAATAGMLRYTDVGGGLMKLQLCRP